MELKKSAFLVSQNWKKVFLMNTFGAYKLEIHLLYVAPNS